MANPLTEVREAIWGLFDADAALAAFIDGREGTRYRLGASENLPVKLAADDCPALTVEPARGVTEWESTLGHQIAYRVEVRGYLDETSSELVEEFAYLAYSALAGGLPDFGIAAVEGVEFAGPVFGTYRKGGARFEEFRLGVVARIHETLPVGAA